MTRDELKEKIANVGRQKYHDIKDADADVIYHPYIWHDVTESILSIHLDGDVTAGDVLTMWEDGRLKIKPSHHDVDEFYKE